MLSQFTKEAEHHRVLGELADFPPDVYPIGRLDRDSEGLLILTNDSSLNQKLLLPEANHKRTYWAQVEGIPTPEALIRLEKGVDIRIKKKTYKTRPAGVKTIKQPELLGARNPPVRYRAHIPDTWLELSLIEGKNRQLRRMCAAVGFPVLRLVRYAIEDLKLSDLAGKEVQKVEGTWLKSRIFPA